MLEISPCEGLLCNIGVVCSKLVVGFPTLNVTVVVTIKLGLPATDWPSFNGFAHLGGGGGGVLIVSGLAVVDRDIKA